jgi:hypothetical protein
MCVARMSKQYAIEHELGLCVEELDMLQTLMNPRRKPVAMKTTYVNVLANLVGTLDELIQTIQSEKSDMGSYIKMIRFVIGRAYSKVNGLNISIDHNWVKVLNTIKHVNSAVSAFEIGAGIVNQNLQSVCGALRVATTIDESEFLNIRPETGRNQRMIELLKNIGNKLNDLQTKPPADFYSFLGGEGSKTMGRLIIMLQSAT